MHRCIKLLAVIALLPTLANAQGISTVQYVKVFTARHLIGIVLDQKNNPIPKVKVELCNNNWKDCEASTATNKDGDFSIPAMTEKKIYFLRLSADGFNPTEIKVRTRLFAKKNFKVRMIVAT